MTARGGPARSGRSRVLGALALTLILFGSALAMYETPGASAAPAGATAAPAPVAATAAPHPASSAAPSTPGPAASPGIAATARPASGGTTGRGTFFDQSNLSLPNATQQYCYGYSYVGAPSTCGNTTVDPSINITSTGTIGVAFTAISNFTNCPSVANISNATSSVIGFQASTTNGASWSAPVYLANANCSAALNLSDAWEPSLTSLANGTFVLAYVQFGQYLYPGCIGCIPEHVPYIYPYDVTTDDLVVQESYNGGATWTAPDIVNSLVNPNPNACFSPNGWPAFRPTITAWGSDVYLAWENASRADDYCVSQQFSAAIQYAYSTDGGITWSQPKTMPTVDGSLYSTYNPTSYSVDPFLLATSTGSVYLAYDTDLNESSTATCVNNTCFGGLMTMDIEFANATNGTGAPWSFHTAARDFLSEPYDNCGPNFYCPMYGDSVQIGYDGIDGLLYLTYTQMGFISICYTFGCGYGDTVSEAVVQNSTTNGASWSTARTLGHLIVPVGGPSEQGEFMPTITVDHNGTAQLALMDWNGSICQYVTIYAYSYCGGYEEMYFNSTTNGSSWNGPVVVSSWIIGPTDDAYIGEYDSAAVAASGQVFFAWTDSTCVPGTTSPFCDFLAPGNPEPDTGVVVSWLYEGVGLTLTYTETGLPSTTPWVVSLLGNIRQGLGPLSIAGVPPALALLWDIPWVNASYGQAWVSAPAAGTPAAPASFTKNTTLAFTFTEFVQLIVGMNPPMDVYYVTPGYNEATYSMTPLPQTTWVAVNTSFTLSVNPQPISCVSYCYFQNLSWVAWAGTGAGSVSSNATSITFTTSTTPINETATFLYNGYCYSSYPYGNGTLYCQGVGDYPLNYHETGLPANTTWAVTTVVNATVNGTLVSESSTPWLNATTGQGAVQYTAWTVPAAGGMEWVPTSATPASPVKEPLQTVVDLTYRLVAPTTQEFAANLSAVGLPNGTLWSADVGNSSYAVTGGSLSVSVPGGRALALDGAPVYTEDGVGYYVSNVTVVPYVVNETATTGTVLPDDYTFNGSAHVSLQYSPMYWLDVSNSTGGTVSPASLWVPAGSSESVTATASPGYHFLDWTGAGPGATSTAQDRNATATIRPTGPVSEFATFRKDPAPTWNVTVLAAGLPSGTGFTVTLGNATYSSTNGTVQVGELDNGSYGFAALDSYAANASGTRWVPTSWYASYGLPGAGGLPIESNGMIWVNYTTQYVLTVATTPDGTVTPSTLVGSTWEDNGTTVALDATPSFHYEFVGWNASGSGSVRGSATQISVRMDSPVWESATFQYRVFPAPATYSLTVNETGLPANTAWNVTAGTGNASAGGTKPALVLSGLNGSYMLSVATVYTALGTRYVANGSEPLPVMVTANRSASVSFATQYALSVSGGLGGSVSGSGTTWEASGASVTLTATPASGDTFVGWNGTGPGSYTGPTTSPQITVGGPVNETATFAPFVPTSTTASPTAGQVPALGLLVALLVVGLVVGLLVGRRGGGGGRAPAEPEPDSGFEAEGTPMDAPSDDTYGGAPPVYDEGTA
jgi:Divergent InlB B-repeat domain